MINIKLVKCKSAVNFTERKSNIVLSTLNQMPFDDAHWRRINMRSVAHLLGAEMLHNLYNRHWPRINSLRFRHTVTTFKAGVVEAYAPIEEWQYLQNWLSKKFISLDPVLLREIEAILSPDYKFVDELLNKIDSLVLTDVSDEELALLLIDIMDYPLGEIYKLNVVQIEYSLNHALHKILEEYEPNFEDRNLLLSKLIAPGELTVSQIEEVAFSKIVSSRLGGGSSVDIESDAQIRNDIQNHYTYYAATHCAYGENPPTLNDYINKYRFMIESGHTPISMEDALHSVKLQQDASVMLLDKLNNPNLSLLCNLMGRIGVFRDKNKAKLGETVLRRLKILQEISRRKDVPLEEINLYLMADLTNLLETNTRVSQSIIKRRADFGVSFIRNEDVTDPMFISFTHYEQRREIKGICASPGKVTGEVKIVHSKADMHKISPADIMIAIGTDFDLLEVMNVCCGIVTEEGGLLSHASVVSRELKKPCLIGVQNATKIFKDGDMIELDATSGTIRFSTD